jgi:hypothetical protein
LEPVASSALSYETSSREDSVATFAAGLSLLTLVRVRRSMFCSCHHSSGRNSTSSRGSLPCKCPFEHGGRL